MVGGQSGKARRAREPRRAVEALGLATGRIGIEHASWFLTLERFDALREAPPDATFVKEPGIIERLRAVKSPRELDALREAGRIAGAFPSAHGHLLRMGVDQVAEEVAEQIEAEHGNKDGQAREGGDPPGGPQIPAAKGDVPTP